MAIWCACAALSKRSLMLCRVTASVKPTGMDCWTAIDRPRVTSPWRREPEASAVGRALPVHTRGLPRCAVDQPGDAVAWICRPHLLDTLQGAVRIRRALAAGQCLDTRCVGRRGERF